MTPRSTQKGMYKPRLALCLAKNAGFEDVFPVWTRQSDGEATPSHPGACEAQPPPIKSLVMH